jgi:hypothetical protein
MSSEIPNNKKNTRLPSDNNNQPTKKSRSRSRNIPTDTTDGNFFHQNNFMTNRTFIKENGENPKYYTKKYRHTVNNDDELSNEYSDEEPYDFPVAPPIWARPDGMVDNFETDGLPNDREQYSDFPPIPFPPTENFTNDNNGYWPPVPPNFWNNNNDWMFNPNYDQRQFFPVYGNDDHFSQNDPKRKCANNSCNKPDKKSVKPPNSSSNSSPNSSSNNSAISSSTDPSNKAKKLSKKYQDPRYHLNKALYYYYNQNPNFNPFFKPCAYKMKCPFYNNFDSYYDHCPLFYYNTCKEISKKNKKQNKNVQQK